MSAVMKAYSHTFGESAWKDVDSSPTFPERSTHTRLPTFRFHSSPVVWTVAVSPVVVLHLVSQQTSPAVRASGVDRGSGCYR